VISKDIHRSALRHNALNGVTGLLVFNGTHFLQVIEGAAESIDELVERLRRDGRHSGVEIRDQRKIVTPSFPDWSMELVRVKASYFEARETIRARIPSTTPHILQELLYRLTETISGTVQFEA
jgi:hypothetical protein